MVFKSSSVALLISSLLACQVHARAISNTDALSVFGSHQHRANSQSDAMASFTRINELKGI